LEVTHETICHWLGVPNIFQPNHPEMLTISIQKLSWFMQVLMAYVMASGIAGIGVFKPGNRLGIWQKERPVP
jgi:hypothetical protein